MPGAYDLIAFDMASGQLTAVVRANIFDRVILAVDVEDDHLRTVDVYYAPLAGRKLFNGSHSDPVAHCDSVMGWKRGEVMGDEPIEDCEASYLLLRK
jgi:hypothetical protein